MSSDEPSRYKSNFHRLSFLVACSIAISFDSEKIWILLWKIICSDCRFL